MIQTVNNVGFGDVPVTDLNERVTRTVCMIIGVILFTMLSTSMMDIMMNESLMN